MTATDIGSGKLEIGRVIRLTFEVLGRNLPTFLVLALILTGLPTIILGSLGLELEESITPTTLAWAATTGAIYVVSSMVLQGALVYGTVNDLNGRRAPVSESLATGLRAFLPLLGAAILAWLGVVAGMLLLIVPGVMLAVAWAVVAPVLIAERQPVMQTFGRSAQLTRGNRWRIFGLFVVYIIAFWIISAIIGVAAIAAGWTTAAIGTDSGPRIATIIINVISNVASGLIGAAGGAVLYAELRRVKEGATPESLAAIFD
jgi:MFS family permease